LPSVKATRSFQEEFRIEGSGCFVKVPAINLRIYFKRKKYYLWPLPKPLPQRGRGLKPGFLSPPLSWERGI
jgi:hypothetical protein